MKGKKFIASYISEWQVIVEKYKLFLTFRKIRQMRLNNLAITHVGENIKNNIYIFVEAKYAS